MLYRAQHGAFDTDSKGGMTYYVRKEVEGRKLGERF